LTAYIDENYDETMVNFRGNEIELTFDDDSFNSRPTINQPFIPTVNELRAGVVKYHQEINPQLLECQVKKMRDARHYILWSPPYTPDVQQAVHLGYREEPRG
jgi:hypothetical protein